jgi:enoyl-CoA hydratase/carnithine racemase
VIGGLPSRCGWGENRRKSNVHRLPKCNWEESMAYSNVIYDKTDRIAKITLNRPKYRNAQSTALLKELDRAFAEAAEDRDVRVVILAGAGDHFSSGHDLGTPDERADEVSYYNTKGVSNRHWKSWEVFLDNTLRWRDLPKATIAQVQGYCIFGGYMFASAMDLIVAADDAMFLPSLTQYFSAPWDVGVRKSKEILFQSRFIDACEGERLGLVNQVVPRPSWKAQRWRWRRRSRRATNTSCGW